jgi:hypothetical protein
VTVVGVIAVVYRVTASRRDFSVKIVCREWCPDDASARRWLAGQAARAEDHHAILQSDADVSDVDLAAILKRQNRRHGFESDTS